MNIRGHLQISHAACSSALLLRGATAGSQINRHKNLLGDASLHPPSNFFLEDLPSYNPSRSPEDRSFTHGTFGIESCGNQQSPTWVA
jgi:hypothetical protein